MGGELSITDLRPFFFEVIEFGKKNEILTRSDLTRIRNEGAEMTVNLAERQYNIVDQAYLWQATYNLCGILSLALKESFESDIEAAANHLKHISLIEIFRSGWKMINLIIEGKKYLKNDWPSLEKDLCEDVSAEPDADWIGWQEFQKLKNQVVVLSEEKSYHDWMIAKWCKKADSELAGWDKDKFSIKGRERRKDIINTLIFSLLISESPFAPLKLKDLEVIVTRVLQDISDKTDESAADEISRKVKKLSVKIPRKWIPLLEHDYVEFLDTAYVAVAKYLAEDKITDASTWMQNYLFVDIKSHEASDVLGKKNKYVGG